VLTADTSLATKDSFLSASAGGVAALHTDRGVWPTFALGTGHSDKMASMRRPNKFKVGSTAAYKCECGEKVVFSKVEANSDATKQCKCGRTIVTYRGSIYGTRRG
jgi:hypothetical protein